MRITFALPVLWIAAAAAIGCTPEESTSSSGDNTPPLSPFTVPLADSVKMGRIASGPDGGVFVGGTFKGTLNFGGGDLTGPTLGTLFVAHLDADGGHLMSGSTGANDTFSEISVGPEGAYFVGGSFDGEVNFGIGKMNAAHAGFLAGFNPDGTTRFARAFPGAYSWVDSVAALPGGGVAIAARATDEVDFGANDAASPDGNADIIVAAYDANGIFQWQVRVTNNSGANVKAAADKDGNVFIASSTYSGFQIGNVEVPPWSLFVAKISPQGALLWAKSSLKESSSFGSIPEVSDLSVDPEGDAYIAGTYYYEPFSIAGVTTPPTQTSEVYAIKIDGAGNGVYAKGFPVYSNGAAINVAGAKGGELLIGLSSMYSVDFGDGGVGTNNNMTGYLARFDAKGNPVKSMALGADTDDLLDDLAADEDGNPVVIGRFKFSISINGEELTSGGSLTGYVARTKL